MGIDTASVESVAAQRGRKGRIFAWALWDWGSSSFNAVATTFVFTVYITGKSFGANASVSASLGWALGLAGLVVFLFAPITGQRSDTSGRRKLWLAVNTAIVVVCLALDVLRAASPNYLVLGLALLAVGTVVDQFAAVNTTRCSPRCDARSIGKVSGFGWGMGDIGGIALLLIVYFGSIHPDVGLFGVTDANGSVGARGFDADRRDLVRGICVAGAPRCPRDQGAHG